jgi:hypothetical protein
MPGLDARRSALGAAASLVLVAAVTVLQFHPHSPTELLSAVPPPVTRYVTADEARRDLSSFFDTLHDRSTEWQPESELQQQQNPQRTQPMHPQLHAVPKATTGLQKIENALANKRMKLELARKMLALERKELAEQSKLGRAAHAQFRVEQQLRAGRRPVARTRPAHVPTAHPHHDHAKTNDEHAETGNPVKDAEIVKKSHESSKEKPTDECIPPKAVVEGESSISFCTGHRGQGAQEIRILWEGLIS